MPSIFARRSPSSRPLRVGCQVAVAIGLLLVGSKSLQDAIAEGDTRTISLHHVHSGDELTITYKRNGRYDEAALEKLNWILRDWRTNEPTKMDPRLIDIVWEVHRELGAKQAIQVIGGYRAPKTNAMLRRRSKGVAEFSQHTQGRAMDFYIPGVPLEQIRNAGLRLQRGGVGFYPGSGSPFVHMDVSGIRHWPRMTREQLVRVFPDGKTVHVPSDGRPLPGYALALAETQRRGAAPSETSLAAARRTGAVGSDTVVADAKKPGVFARLFGLGASKDEDEEAAEATPNRAPPSKPVKTAAATEDGPDVPLPRAKPGSFRLAAAFTEQAVPRPPRPIGAESLSPSQIIDARGYWQGSPEDEAAQQRLATAFTKRSTRVAGADAAAAIAALTNGTPLPGSGGHTLETTSSLRAAPIPEAALSYAHAGPPDLASESAPIRAAQPRITMVSALPEQTTVAVKKSGGKFIRAANAALPSTRAKAGDQFNEPWLRSVIVSPSARSFLTATMMGQPDYRILGRFFDKPGSAVVMTFSDAADAELPTERFSGDAIVFVPTVSFATRTAALQ